jgi:hypothetical protein
VLELCLRFLGIELEQDEIALVVKRTGGTPMFEIARYLDDMGVAARRIEATPARLRANPANPLTLTTPSRCRYGVT